MKSQAVLSAHKCSVGISVERALTTPPRSNVNCQSRTNGCYSSSVVLNVRDEKIYPLKAAVTDIQHFHTTTRSTEAATPADYGGALIVILWGRATHSRAKNS